MIQSIPIKKEIIKTFLKNVNKPIEEISSMLFKQLNRSYLRGEKMICDKTAKCVILRTTDNIYKVRLNNGSCLDVEYDRIVRQEPISKNVLYGFLAQNTTQTIFGRVLKLNIYSEIKKSESDKDKEPEIKKAKVNPKKTENVQQKLKITDCNKSNSVIMTKDELYKKYENKTTHFEIYVFFTQFTGLFNFDSSFNSFDHFISEYTSQKFKYTACKELMRLIRADAKDAFFNDLITVSLRSNSKIIETIKDKRMFSKVQNIDWRTESMDNGNWTGVLKNFILYAVSIDSTKSNFGNIEIFDEFFFILLKFLIDTVVYSAHFKEHVDKLIDKTRKLEREKYDLNSRLKRVDTSKKDGDNDEQQVRNMTKKLAEIDSFCLKNRVNPRFGQYEGLEYYFVNSEIYYTSKNDLFHIENAHVKQYMKQFKSIKEASHIVNTVKSILSLTSN